MKTKYWVLTLTSLGVLILDQWTKLLVLEKLPLYRRVEVIPGFFNLTHVRNTGGAFGIFGGEKGGLGSFLFVAISCVAILSILFFFKRLGNEERTLRFPLALVLGGAVGNLIDRLRFGEVIDFLDFSVASYHWPAFNIADSAICLGIALMAFDLLVLDHRKSRKSI